MHQAHIPPAAGADALAPKPVRPDPVQLVLQHTLSMTTALTEEELIACTLAAACDVTGADVAAALRHGIDEAGGPCQTTGDHDLAARLVDAARAPMQTRPGGLTTAFARVGLPSAITVNFGGADQRMASGGADQRGTVGGADQRIAGGGADQRGTGGDILIIVASTVPERLGVEAGSLLALVVAHAQASRDRLRELDQLSRRADSDPLTGLRHHRPFSERLAASSPGHTAVFAVDVDDFKKINDRYGHQAGDLALVSLVGALRAALRGDDQLYRIGGDEFAVVVDVFAPAEVVAIARRLLEAARRVGQTVSVGAALQQHAETARETLRRADEALYRAKRAGRDTARLAA